MRFDRREFLARAAAGAAAAGTLKSGAASTDPLGVRADFPVCERETYLNTPYIGPIPRAVEAAGAEFLRRKAEDPISLGDMLARTQQTREKIAALVGAAAQEIAFLFATSEGENLVTAALDLRAGDNVVVDDLHYTTTYVLYKTLERTKGIELRIVSSSGGRVTASDFEPRIDSRTRLLSVSWVSHQNGFRHDLRELAGLVHAQGALLYADGIQALGMFPARLREQGVDFMTSGTYKWLFAGYGIAPFFIREEHLSRITPDRMGALSLAEEGPDQAFRLFPDARKYEYATLAFGPLYQLEAAVDYLDRVGLDRIEAHTLDLARRMRRGLLDLGFEVRTPEDGGSAIVAFLHGKEPEKAQDLFRRNRVRVSFRESGSQIRAGAALFNHQADVERFLQTAEELRRL